MPLPDVEAALRSLQEVFDAGELELEKCVLDRELFVHADLPNGILRLTYVRIVGEKVASMVQFAKAEPVEGEPCFSVGWAVPKEFRGQGRSGETFIAAVKEMRHGFAPHGMTSFWLEGIVGVENVASRRVAEKVISAPVSAGTDSFADAPIVQYLRRIDSKTEL